MWKYAILAAAAALVHGKHFKQKHLHYYQNDQPQLNLTHTDPPPLLLDLESILLHPSQKIPLYDEHEPPSAVINILDDYDDSHHHHKSKLNRSKRIIPHEDFYYTNNNLIDHSAPIYVTDDGEHESKVSSSGPWGEWSGPSECSRSCGGGVAYQTRVCEDQDESVCQGAGVRYFSCNTHACGGGSIVDFRAEQCSAYNSVPFEGRFYTWLPYTRAPNKCELNCMPQGERFYYRHKRKVIDGTSCGVDLICVNGNCLPVGCDGILGSRKRQDKCRVCGGDGSSCNTVQGVFDSNDLQVGYNDVLLIPAGATNIVVRETQASNNYLAIRNTSGHYYLNGNWRIDFPREIPIASTTFHYERKPHTFFAPETIRSLGPISEAIYIVVLYQESNPGITFEYSVPRGVVLPEEGTEYAWIYDDWQECSRECGGGTQNRNVNCARRSPATMNWDYVEPHLCDNSMKPETFKYCNYEIPCPVRWRVGGWDDCTAPCGSNETGTQYRQVFCEQEVQGVSALVENERCVEAQGPAPDKLRNCTSSGQDLECTYWFVGEWKGCSSLCGDGYNTRVVRCVSKDELGRVVIHGDEKCTGNKPIEYEYCFTMPCEGVDWIVEGDWGECQVPSTPTCNSPTTASMGTQSREVYCSDAKGKVYNESYCHSYRKPNTTQPCELDFNPAEDPSCKYTWYATQWTDCEFQSCSEMHRGKKHRVVFCGTVLGDDGSMKVVDEENCNSTKKYHNEEECVVEREVVDKQCGDEEARKRRGRWFAGPWGECSKPCGGGRRSRQVLCMVGNRSTTDVTICGEEKVVYTSEDCNKISCDELPSAPPPPAEEVGEEEMVTDQPELDEESSTVTEEPCEPIDEDYYDYYDDEEEEEPKKEDDDEGTMVTGRSTRSVMTTTETMMMMSEETMETGGTTEESMMSGATDDVTMETMVSGDDEMMMSGATESMMDDLTSATEEEDSSGRPTSMTESTVAGGSTEAIMTGSTEAMASSAAGVSMTTMSGGETTTAAAITTTQSQDITTTEPVTTTTEPPTTTTTTTEAVTTTTEMMTTTEQDTTTTTTEAETTTTAGTTTTTIASLMTSTIPSMTTIGGVGSTDESMMSTTIPTDGGGETSGSTIIPDDGVVTMMMTTTPRMSIEDMYYDEDAPPLRMIASSDSSVLYTGSTETSSDVAITGEDDYGVVTEVDYITDYATELGFTTGLPPVTLPLCKPKPRKPKPPSFCHKSAFGCCPDKQSNATGPFHAGCKIAKTCNDTEFGCCDDGVTPAENKGKKNCRVDCKNTLFGCCPDGKGVALGNNAEGCVKDCNETKFGCCLDGKTAKKGPKGRNCPKIPCSKAIYGCCPDNKTPAMGPSYKDCKEINLENCKLNFFGCCIDGTTSALGPDEEGCPDTPPCVRTSHGCCPDGVTSAHGPNNEGCCASSRYGCCPDNINEALGPDFQGCDCASSPYGCCPDNKTPARGPNQDCGCKFTEHGCCPDGVSQADGANFEGCGCSTFQFGCCPDGITVAKGPNDQGCGCAYTEFGCCPDNRTPKNSSDGDCGCESSLFGCCPDGNTHAQGNDFEGCEDIPIKPGEVCGLDKVRGSCRNFTVRWFFDMEYGGCSRFWWGGCEGNLNKFMSQEECRSVCVEPEGRDACYLPKVSGPCEGYYPSWFYDPVRETCEQFIYSGCLGNNNRFQTRQECENNCLLPDRVDDCDQPKTEGPCRGNYTRFYYDKTSEKCETFTYGGCKGNSNNFLTEKECHQRCGKDVRMRDVCFQPRSEGPCNEKLPRWYYDAGEQRCAPFYYSGCQGNANRFSDLGECEKTCPAALLAETTTCLEPLAIGDCASYTERYHFDRYEGKCKTFIYSGCGGNSNNFISIDDCRTKCETFVPKPVASSEDQQFSQAHCSQPPPDDPTSCNDSNRPPTIRWYYDYHDGVCHQFRYYCSESSLNNFDTRQDCEDKCASSQDFCTLPVVTGPCSGKFLQYYYDRESDSCQSFEYSGCSGNGNRFDTVVQCEQRCKRTAEVDPNAIVISAGHDDDDEDARRRYEDEIERRRIDDERRRQEEERRRYEDDLRRQEEERRRLIEEQNLVDTGHGGGGVTQDDICVLPMDVGPCRAAVRSYFYSRDDRKCVEFLYGGCGGNANRFESEEMCERQCGEFRGQDVCNQTPDPGPCTQDSLKSQKWYFNTNDQACALFVHSGCGGNGNKFSSRDECESVCHTKSEMVSENDTITGAAICRLPPDTGPCVDGFKRWYYNHEDKTCIPFVFGGCAGNLNRFKSFDTCVNFCEKALGYTYRVRSSSNNNEEPPPHDNTMMKSGDNYYSDDNGHSPSSSSSSHHHDPSHHHTAPCDCSFLKCPYGLLPQNGTYCDCQCNDPCSRTYCPESSRCSVDIQGSSFVPVCRSVRKQGSCPALHHTRHHHMICDNECSSDADCPGDLKCCMHGCGSSCMRAVIDQGGVTLETSVEARERFVNESEGGLVEMECSGRGNPRPDIQWVRVDSNEKITGESGRYRIIESSTPITSTSRLQIIGPSISDAGTYSCIATSPNTPPVQDQVEVQIHESSTPRAASVLEDPTIPTTQIVDLGQTANLRCFALGWPKPSVTWWRGERMLPFSSERYEQMRDYSLVVRLVSLRDLGVYTCQAYNGLGRAASWSISLLTYGPVEVKDVEDREYLVYVLDRGVGQVYRNFSRGGVTSSTTTTTTTTTTERVDFGGAPYIVPLRANIQMGTTHFNTGSEIRIPCEVEGYPTPTVRWYLNDVPIDLSSSRRVRYDPPDLLIPESSTSDTGTYRCEASNEYGSVAHATVSISVEGMDLHANCTDNSFFANCKLIVKANYCTNKYYARFCCKSCTLAGQLPAYGPHLQEVSQAYFRRSQQQQQYQQHNNNRGIVSELSNNNDNQIFN